MQLNIVIQETKEYNTKATVRDPVAGDVIDEIHRGFQTMPTLYGSDVRPAGEVTGIGSGISEGAKVCLLLYYSIEIIFTISPRRCFTDTMTALWACIKNRLRELRRMFVVKSLSC